MVIIKCDLHICIKGRFQPCLLVGLRPPDAAAPCLLAPPPLFLLLFLPLESDLLPEEPQAEPALPGGIPQAGGAQQVGQAGALARRGDRGGGPTALHPGGDGGGGGAASCSASGCCGTGDDDDDVSPAAVI